MGFDQIQHVFVLMLENRSFDHMLGYSGITGTDAATGAPTKVNGPTGHETNFYNGTISTVTSPADFVMPVDPPHEFADVLCQLCGPAAKYPSGGAYPNIDNSGYVAAYTEACAKANMPVTPGEIMKCYSPDQLPVLNALAREFAVCDNWHASLPGPTWPNRMFVHAASSAGLEHSPSTAEIVAWELTGSFAFPNGTIFDRIAGKGLTRRLYAGDKFPMMAALKGLSLGDIRDYSNFANDLKQPTFPYNYVFIEPSYKLLDDYRGSTSQHPLDDVRLGEGLIKSTYEAIRNSAYWQNSLLIVTWDEHGGFYDHGIPPAAVAPGDTLPNVPNNQSGFTFEQYGPRVPAVIVSPWIPKNTIDHRLYDHSSIPATLEKLLGLEAMTARDAAANSVLPLLSLSAVRTDTLITLPSPADTAAAPLAMLMASVADAGGTSPSRPNDSANDGSLPVVVGAAMQQDLQMSPDIDRDKIIAKVATIKSRTDAAAYMAHVAAKRTAAKAIPVAQ